MQSTYCDSLQTANQQRWEDAKKVRRRQIGYCTIGMAIFIPVTPLVTAGAIYGTTKSAEKSEPFLLTSALAISSVVLIFMTFIIEETFRNARKVLKKDFLWSIKDVNAFENTLREKPLSSLDKETIEVASKSGVISKENYVKWCGLMEQNIRLIQKRSGIFDLEDIPASLISKVQERQENYKVECEQLENKWKQLKEHFLSDLPMESDVILV